MSAERVGKKAITYAYLDLSARLSEQAGFFMFSDR